MKIGADGRKLFSISDCEQIAKAYQKGQTLSALARKNRCDIDTIRNALKRLGIDRRPGGPKNFSRRQCQEMVSMYARGHTLAEIATFFQCAPQTIRRVVHRQGVNIRPKAYAQISPEDVESIVDLYRTGQTQKQIARQFKTTTPTVRRFLKAAGLTILPGGHRKIHPDDYPKLVEAYQSGRSLRKIAKEWNCTRPAIANILRKIGVLHCNDGSATQPKQTQHTPSSLSGMERQFWLEDGRAVDMVMFPPDIQRQILYRVRDALRYAFETLMKDH